MNKSQDTENSSNLVKLSDGTFVDKRSIDLERDLSWKIQFLQGQREIREGLWDHLIRKEKPRK